MNFTEPKDDEYTIYSKSGCPNCMKSKELLKENNLTYSVINCDEYLLECKEEFLNFIKTIATANTNTIINTFPIIFNNRIFVGGFKELQTNIQKNTLGFDSDF
jgi:glutaredoxin